MPSALELSLRAVMYVGPVRKVRGDKKLDANCCLYVGVQLLIPPDLVNRSTSPCRGTS